MELNKSFNTNMQLQVFKYHSEEEQAFNEIRTIETPEGKILFGATDVARMLGYGNPNDAIIRHCRSDGIVNHEVIDSLGRKQTVKFVSEGNVYRLIVKSQLPSAEKFEQWLFDEVIPSIRTKGYYGKIDRVALPNFIERYKDNYHKLPKDHFSVISEMYARLYMELEKVGYSLPVFQQAQCISSPSCILRTAAI
jgi:prophage antirepressor-like protein